MKTHTHSKTTESSKENTTLVLGGTGKTGRRVVDRLETRGLPVRVGSRSAAIPFDWGDRSIWPAALQGVHAVYVSYCPDLAVPGAPDDIRHLVDLLEETGVRKLVLLSGRGEEEAQRCEQIVRNSGLDWTIVRCSWFNQNFSENFMSDMVVDGVVTLPAGDVAEPFVDCDDIADVAAAALTEDRHSGQLYELTGPELLTFPEVVAKIAEATGRDIRFQEIPREDFVGGLRAQQLPPDLADLLDYLFTTVLDGRNASLADGVQRALGREPRTFAGYARKVAAEEAWVPAETVAAA